MECVFCQIIAGKIPTDFLYQDDKVVVFRDIHPQAPVHVLIVPREHIPSLDDLSDERFPVVGYMAMAANKVAKQEGLKNGYRLVINNGKEGGQVVPHLHMHLLGGRRFHGRQG